MDKPTRYAHFPAGLNSSYRTSRSPLVSLSGLSPELKRRLLSACAECVAFDHQISTEEAELFRAIADTLGCPVPPLLPGQPLA